MQKSFSVSPERWIFAALCLSLAGASSLSAQRTGFEAGDGSTSIFLQNSGAISFNVADTSIRFAYARRVSDSLTFWGLEAVGKPSDGIADYFQKGKPASNAGGSVMFGRHFVDIDNRTGNEVLKDHWVVFQGTYNRSSINNVAAADAGNRKINFDGYGATVAYNARFAPHGDGTGMLFGISAGVERRNNLEDLTPVTIDIQVASAVTATQTTITKQEKTGYFGPYHQYVAAPLYTDLVFLPLRFKSRIAFDAFTRSDLAHSMRSFSPGVGVFYTAEGQPTKVIGGVSAAYADGNLRIGLVAGFNF